ncbi:MAG: hypothetical protein IJL02_03985 [Methanobrevibacter sp.]|uniref:hypothetical protein n=1 Tax=Methanobrevibacter sp. TaxID=66852 RepID=UPI0025FAA588|nr:hypothetical protein [Methanobrevibacter sp.]MBQ6099004.1 hypothetical protein [Methanobrevibacter sp.]
MNVKLSKSISKSRNSTGLYRVSKLNDSNCKQGFRWRYTYWENNKHNLISATSIKKLKEKILKKGLEWRVLDVEKVKETFPNDLEILTEDCFHCDYAQSNEDGIHCYRENRKRVNGKDTCEYDTPIKRGGNRMTKRFTTDSPTMPVTQFKITDFWLNRELTTMKEVVDAMNDQQETIKLLQKANENISRASYEISRILEDGGVILTKEQLDEIIREGSYKKKVAATLQEKNDLVNRSLLVGAPPQAGKYMGQLVQKNCSRLLHEIAKDLQVELK